MPSSHRHSTHELFHLVFFVSFIPRLLSHCILSFMPLQLFPAWLRCWMDTMYAVDEKELRCISILAAWTACLDRSAWSYLQLA